MSTSSVSPARRGKRIVVDAQCARIGSAVDPSIRLSTLDRGFVASADDTPGLMTDARLTATLPADGDYVIELSDSRYQGGGPARSIGSSSARSRSPTRSSRSAVGQGETVGFELRGGTLLRSGGRRRHPAPRPRRRPPTSSAPG